MIKRIFTVITLFCFTVSVAAQESVSPNNWYVGHTEAGEWVKFKKVWLSAGNYRFTTRAVAASSGNSVHLELNGQTLTTHVEIPSNGKDTFQLVHLGSKYLYDDYYDIKFVFETGNVNCDMVFIKKDSRTETGVLPTDIEYHINNSPNVKIFVNCGGTSSGQLAKGFEKGDDPAWEDPNGNPYTREQMLSWNRQQIYAYALENTPVAYDYFVQETVEAKINVIHAHGRGEPDTVNQITDRAFKWGRGGLPCKANQLLVDAINRNPYARGNLKIAYFLDTAAPNVNAQNPEYYTGKISYGDPDFQNFIWEFAIKKFYQTIPREMLHEVSPGVVPIQFWSANANYTFNPSDPSTYQLYEFFEFIKAKMKQEFDLDVALVLGTSYFTRDPRTYNQAYGVQAWFTWRTNITQMLEHKGKYFAFALNGGRLPLNSTMLNDWNPATNQGTCIRPTGDAYVFPLTPGGEPVIRPIFEEASAAHAERLVLEGWADWREGSTFYRSDAGEYVFPNQYMALVREFADPQSESIVLEVEGCDEFYDKSAGNAGGSYRWAWYNELKKDFLDANLSVELDIFRPLHRLSPITKMQNQGDVRTFDKIAAGVWDVWAIQGDTVYTNRIDGTPLLSWPSLRYMNKHVFKKIAFGAYYAWGITATGKVVNCNYGRGYEVNMNSQWVDVTVPEANITDLDLNNYSAWGVDDQNNVYYRDLGASRSWTKIDGNLCSIVVDESSGWGFAPDGSIKRFSLQSKSDWTTVNNPHQLIKLSASNGEIWGVNAGNEVYRINASGVGKWEYVAGGFKEIAVGNDYVWLLDVDGVPYMTYMSGFENATVFNRSEETGLTDLTSSKQQICVYPNPVTDELKIKNEETAFGSSQLKIEDVSIFDMTNKIILKSSNSQISKSSNSINVSALPQGVYFVRIATEAGITVHKIIKK